MPKYKPLYSLYKGLKESKYDVPDSYVSFQKTLTQAGDAGAKSRRGLYKSLKESNYDVPDTYEDFYKNLFVPVNSTTSRALKIGENPNTPAVNRYHQKLFDSVDPNKNGLNALSRRAVSQAKIAMNNVRKPVTAKVVDKKGKPTGGEFAITPAKTLEDLDREYAQETTKNWENELHDQMADADKDAAKISDMFKSFIGSTDEVGSVWGNMTRGGGIAGIPHSVTTNNGILENTESRQLLAASDYNRKRKELLQLEQDSRNGAIFDDHSFFRGMYDAVKDTGLLTGGASDLINAGSLLSTKQDLDNGVHTEAGDMLLQQAVKNSNAQGQYGNNQGWMYTGGVITTNMAPFMVQIASAGFSKGLSTSIGKVVQGAASKVALGTMKKAAGFASADLAKNIGKFTGLSTKAFGKAVQYGIVGAAQANTVGLGNVANDVMNRYTGQVYQDEQGNYKFGTFDSDGNLVHEGGEDFLTALAKGDAAQSIEFATELAGGGIDAVGTALKNFVKKGGKEIIKKYNMENVSKVIDFLLNNKVSKNVRYLKAGADRTLGKVELNSIVGESLEEELGIIANTVFTGDNKISDLWDEKQQSQIWGGMLLSIGLMKGAVAPFHAYNAKQYYSYKHKLNKADANLSQLLGNEKWEELRDQIDATTNKDMPDMINKINRDVALGKNRQPVREYIQNLIIMRGYDIGNMLAAKKAVEDKGEGVSVKNMEKNQAYQQGRDAYGYDTHEIQLDQEDKQKSLAQLLGISEQQLSGMSDEELESMTGQDDKLDRAIYDYQLSSARYEGVVDNARDQIDLEVQRAAQAVDMYTDKSRNTIRNATIKATGGQEDYGVYIINGNIATHDDGSIDISNSDDMILYYDPTTNKVEHADAMMFAELGSEENADEVRNQAMADAKEKAIKETTGIIDGVVEVGTQFKTVDADGTEHTYEVLADNGDGTAMITIDGNIPTEIVKGENVNIPVSFEELQKMKDASDQQRLQAAKAQREQMEKERAEQQNQAQTTQAENPAQESNTQSAPIEDNLDYSDIIREDGKVQMVDVSDKDGNNLFPEAKDVFYIQGNKIRTKFAYIDANGELKTQSFPTGLVKIKTRGEVSVDDYKKYRNTILAAESSAMPESSMIEGNSGEDRGEIEAEPIGTGAFGNIYNQFKGKVKEAFNFLMRHKSGDLLGVFHRDDVGDIDLVWGNEKMGLAHILGKHVGEGKDFETPDDAIAMIENVINSGRVFQDNENRYTLMLDGVGVGIRKSFDGEKKNWVVTAVDFNRSQEEKGIVTNPTSTSHGVTEPESAAALNDSNSKDINNSSNGNENNESLTFEDGTPIPVDENGETDLSQTDATHAAEWYDNNLGEDADGWLDGEIKKAKKVLEQAKNRKLTGTKPSELVASKNEKEVAIADAQAHYDSAISIRDALKERRIAKEENTPEGRKNLIEKARRKFARLKSSVNNDAEAVAQLYRGTVGSLLHRLYDSTGVDVTDTVPLTAEEYVASNLGAHSLNYEGNETSKGVKQETGLSREDFAKTQLLAADGKGTTIDALVHSLWDNRPSNLESLDTQDIRNALIDVLTSGFKASEARSYIENIRIAQAEKLLEEQELAAENAAYAEQQKAKEEEEKKKAEEEDEETSPLEGRITETDEESEVDGEYGITYNKVYLIDGDKRVTKVDEPDEKGDYTGSYYMYDGKRFGDLSEVADYIDGNNSDNINEKTNENTNFPDKLKEGSETIEVPEDATDENPLGLQLSEDKVLFEIKGEKSGDTYDINDKEDRQRLVAENSVDDKDILDIDMPEHVHKAIKELCKKMGLKVQFLYMGARLNGWIENGTMYLALDANKATQSVFGHEMTHAIKQKNPEAYKELVKVAMAVTTKKEFEEDLAKVYRIYHNASGYNNIDDFVEEVIADNIGKFINDHDLAQRFVLRLNHPVLATILHAIQKIKGLLYGDFYKSVDALERIVEKAYVDTANGEVTNSETGEDVSFSLRQKPEPKKKGIGYKVFVLKDGKLYPPMVANPDGAATPVGVWLDADAAPIAGESKTGRPQVKQGGKGTQGGSGKLAYRPGWHLGVVPYAIQFNRKDAEGNKTLFPKNFVFAEVEYAADVDYQEEARQEGINPSGKYQHSLAGLKHLPTDGYYMYRTNPNPETDPWVITGAMKVNRILTRAEQAELVKNAGREPQQIQEGDIVTDDVVNSINQEIAAVPKFSLKVYHGSGADFTEFDFDHMGEGAGSQAFGWGGYVTSSKKIGKDYARLGKETGGDYQYMGDTKLTSEQARVLAVFVGLPAYKEYSSMKEGVGAYIKSLRTLEQKGGFMAKHAGERIKVLESVLPKLDKVSRYDFAHKSRNLYEVDIPDDNGSNYLDFENPMSEEQINAIRDALAKKGIDVPSWEKRGFKLDLPFKNVYAAVLPMMMRCKPKEVSQFLSSIGFTGIKYPAGTIIQGGAEEGDTNYVIFKPEDMKITEHTKFSIKTYHGSQASFDKFDHSFMGSGEGAQAYGWGTYVSEVEGIAKAYAKQNAAKHGMPREYKIAQTRLNHAKFEYDKVQRSYDNSKAYIDSLKEDLQNYRESIARRKEKVEYFAQNNMPETVDKLLKQIKRTEDTIKVTESDINMRTIDLEGWKPKLEEAKKKYEEEQKKFDAIPKPQIERNLYSVDIPDDTGENYLGWDEKMTPRMRDIRKEILEDNGYKLVDSDDMRDYFEDRDGKEYELFKEQYKTGGTFYEELAQLLHSQKLASLALKEYGFDGVKVIADRNTGGNKEGKMNYVIFDENNAQITNHTKFSLRLKSAIEETETNPSDAQKESGNYKKGHIKFGGYDYTIENPKGSTRSGKDSDGKEWKVTMHDTYGYIRGKFGKDGDHLDMFINDKADLDNWDGDVFVVDQVNPDGSFDEHKVMYGYDSMDDAEKAYLANYSKGWKGLGNITGASKTEFDKWLDTSNRKLKPFADYAKVKFSQAQSVSEPRYSLKDIKPVGVGSFGNIYNQFRGNAKAAIEFLKKVRGGEAVGALHHKDIGDIDLVWGKEGTGHSDGYGLSKLVKYHPEVLDNLQEILNDMRVVSSSKNRVNLESETHKAGVRLTWDGERKSWLLTAFKKETSASDKRTDTAATSLEGDTALSQTEGSAAKIDNSSETAKENDEKFSLKDEKTLAGVHNITEEKLRKALKLGGFANPSLAVIDTNKTGHDNFGEISFIAPSALVDKRTGKTAGTWITDAYTQRYPSVEREMSEKGSQKFRDWVDSLEYPSEAKAEIKRQAEDALSNNNAPAWELMYLKEKGIDIKEYDSRIDYRWKEIIRDYPTAEDILNSMQTDPELNEKVTSLAKHAIIHPTWEKVSLEVRRKMYKETGVKASPINPQVRKQTKEIFERDYAPTLLNKDGSPRKKDVKKVVEDIVKEHNDTKKYDFYLSKVKASNYVNKNGLYDDYIRWQENKLDEFGTKNRIFRGYTKDGSRKYVPETLENVSKAMREEADGQTNGSEYTSFGSFIAKLASRVDSTDEMRANKDKLSSNKDKEEFYEKWSEVYYDLAKFLYNDVFYGEQRLHDIVLQSDPKKYAKKEYGITLTPTFMKKLDALKNAVQTELKSAYFETKYNRPLRLNEFAAAVVPDNLGEDVRKGIEDAGLPMYDYDPNKEGDRSRAFNEAINSSDNIRFSLKSMMAKPEGWKQANKKAIHIAEAIERDPKFSLKNLDGTLIKAGTYFSGGGLVEEGLKGIIDPVVAVEYDEKISGVYRNNFGQHIVTADVRDVDPKELVKQIDGEVEYFHASPVCKNYSQAKSNHAEVELDKETAASTAEFINAIKPKVVTIENVKGYKDSEAMKTITDALDANGYTWDADVYNAADYGGYTNRERLIVRAVRDGKLPAKPEKMARKSGWYEAVADIIPTLTEKKNGVAPWMDIRLKADGIDWRNIDKPLYVMGSAYADGKVPHAFADELLPTLRTKSGDVIVMPDGKVYRAMGRVLARVSGVSDDYKMPFSENLSHTIIGNGIPTQLTEHVIAPLLQNTLRPTTPDEGNTKFSLRGSTPYDKQMEEWMEKNHLEKGAVPMEKPVMKEGENIFDYANRMVEWTRNQNLWKTAPKQTGFQDALDKWKADNGLSPDAYPPVRPHRENYSTEIGYTEDLEEYNKKKELWKSAPKPKDFDLSVDLEDMNKQLRNIRRAVLNQKNYDQRTIKAVSDLVRKMLNIGWGDGLSRGKVGNLLSAAKNATGANDVKKYLDKAMGILAENYLNRLSTAYDNLINTKGARADQSGVIKMGSLDANGQAFMSEYKKAINMDDKSLNNYVANIEEDSAKNEDNVEMNDYRLAGIQASIMYKQQIGGNDADIAELQRQIGELKNKKDATKEDKDLLKSLEKKLFENKFDRITMYENLLNNIQRMVKESKGRAKEFREEIAEHKNEILHLANLDLEGVDSTYYDTTNAKKKLVNNDLQRAVFSSTYTFEQFLKFFGKKAANGEGRLYNYFTKLNQDALDEEQLYNEMNRNALDEKTKELFGKKKFMNLVGIDGNGMKEMDIEVTDYSNKKTGKRTIHLKQGQMLYIYLVNKETDGEMKLRAMGITEEDVAAIEENLDPRVKAMGEWLQDEYLPECQRRYQATHTKYFGAPMKEVENYFPLAINNRARNVKEDVNQDSDAMSQLAGTSTGAIVTRRVNVIPLDIENADAFEVAFNHLQEMEEWSAMLPFRQDINTLLSYTHFRNQVQNMSSVAYGSGKTLWDEFKQTAQIAAGTYKPKVNAGMMDSRIAAAMGGIAVAKISGRLWTAIKQSQSATVFLPECDFTRFVKNGVNPYGSWKWAMENIPDFRKRVENMTYGDVKLRQYLDELEKWHDWTKTISKIGMAPNILVDGITCAVGARSVYETEVNRLTKLGYPKEKAEEKAYYKAVAAYNKTQQSSGGMYLSPMQVDRTYVSAALSLFKNANYAYGRMQIEACRGLARTYDFWGGKHKTTLIESMTRQIMEEDGLDENTARAIAKATYNRTFRQSIGRLINFATLVPVSWALYKVLPYLLTGDDDDKKNDMIEEAVLKGFATSLSDNYVIPFASNILNAGLKVDDGKPTFDPEVFRYQNLYINPATSDLANIYSMVGNQKWYSVANKLGMLGVQSLIGFNPETVGALYQVFAEADYDNGNTTKEWQIGILKAISAPEESIRELYMDELGLKSGDIKKIPLAELEKRYAERQINRDNLLSQIGMDAETFNGYVDKYQKSFENKIKDKMDKWDEYDKKKADEFFDTTSDPKLKDMIEKKRAKDANAAADEQIAKEGLNQEKKGKEPSEEAYDAVKMSIDVAEDNAISTYNKVLNKRYAALNDEYNEQTDAMKYIFMSKHPNFKAYKELESEYTNYGKKIKELKEKLVSADGYDAKQTILKQIRAEREKFSGLQSKVR